MPKLTITNLLSSNVLIQEFSGNYSFSQVIPAGATKSYVVPLGLAESLERSLTLLEAQGRISWTASQDATSRLETSISTAGTLTFTQATRPAPNAVGASATNKVFGVNTTTGEQEYSDGVHWYDSQGSRT